MSDSQRLNPGFSRVAGFSCPDGTSCADQSTCQFKLHDGSKPAPRCKFADKCKKRPMLVGQLSDASWIWRASNKGTSICMSAHVSKPLVQLEENLAAIALAPAPASAVVVPVVASAPTTAVASAQAADHAWQAERFALLGRIESQAEVIQLLKEQLQDSRAQNLALLARLTEKEATKEVAAIPVVAENVVSPTAGKAAGHKPGGQQCPVCRAGDPCGKSRTDNLFHLPSCPSPCVGCTKNKGVFHYGACFRVNSIHAKKAKSTRGKASGSRKRPVPKGPRKGPKGKAVVPEALAAAENAQIAADLGLELEDDNMSFEELQQAEILAQVEAGTLPMSAALEAFGETVPEWGADENEDEASAESPQS